MPSCGELPLPISDAKNAIKRIIIAQYRGTLPIEYSKELGNRIIDSKRIASPKQM
jgi:hypothetical protein